MHVTLDNSLTFVCPGFSPFGFVSANLGLSPGLDLSRKVASVYLFPRCHHNSPGQVESKVVLTTQGLPPSSLDGFQWVFVCMCWQGQGRG